MGENVCEDGIWGDFAGDVAQVENAFAEVLADQVAGEGGGETF